jgi:DNA-binding MarR family transcriptional regulator
VPERKKPYDVLEDIGFLLTRSSGIAVRSANDRLAELGLRVRSHSVLAIVVRVGGVSQRALSDMLGLDPSQIVALVDDLQSQGLIERRAVAGDRRVRELAATRRGRERLKQAAKVVVDGQAEVFAGLDANELDTLRGLLTRIVFRNTGEAEAVS